MSDCDLVLSDLKKGGVTANGVWKKHGIQRLSARIFDLREKGYAIETVKKVVSTKRGAVSNIAVYYLRGES